MERWKPLTMLVAWAVGMAAVAGAYFLSTQLTVSPNDRALEFVLDSLNTSYGWFYEIEGLRTEPRQLAEYNVTLYVLSPPDAHGNQEKRPVHSGPVARLGGAAANLAFEDRSSQPGRLDEGDYFWAREWRQVEVERAGRVVGGTLACG